MVNFTDSFTASPSAFEIPEQVRAFADKGVAQAREQYARFKDVAENNNTAVEAAFGVASKGASDYSTKLLGFFQANTYAAFDLAQQLVGVKSLAEAADVWGSHARKQVETLTSQSQELAELSRKVATETVEPIKDSVSRIFKPVA
jgi:phasin